MFSVLLEHLGPRVLCEIGSFSRAIKRGSSNQDALCTVQVAMSNTKILEKLDKMRKSD